jgi:hypothetical protein
MLRIAQKNEVAFKKIDKEIGDC